MYHSALMYKIKWIIITGPATPGRHTLSVGAAAVLCLFVCECLCFSISSERFGVCFILAVGILGVVKVGKSFKYCSTYMALTLRYTPMLHVGMCKCHGLQNNAATIENGIKQHKRGLVFFLHCK